MPERAGFRPAKRIVGCEFLGREGGISFRQEGVAETDILPERVGFRFGGCLRKGRVLAREGRDRRPRAMREGTFEHRGCAASCARPTGSSAWRTRTPELVREKSQRRIEGGSRFREPPSAFHRVCGTSAVRPWMPPLGGRLRPPVPTVSASAPQGQPHCWRTSRGRVSRRARRPRGAST